MDAVYTFRCGHHDERPRSSREQGPSSQFTSPVAYQQTGLAACRGCYRSRPNSSVGAQRY